MITQKTNIRALSLLFQFLVCLLPLTALFAQAAAPGEWLVQLRPDASPEALTKRLEGKLLEITDDSLEDTNGRLFFLTPPQLISKSLNVWHYKPTKLTEDILPWLSRQPEVLVAQANHYLSERSDTLPNDPLFPQQWQYQNDGNNGGLANADLDAELAWGISSGGLSKAGDTIVIAVIDGGVNKVHADLLRNLWKNRAEIPNDGIDNDNNGYVDDYQGWNVFSQNDNIQGINTAHGTPVCGIIGASGDNNIGVTGVNWNVKIMFVAGGNLESDMIAAYDYVFQARNRYNETNGNAGAFVVATNCSWGIDFGIPANSPLWCQAFDKLGEAGILSVTATANNPVNVDIVGDLPTTCPSDFLISVTSLNRLDLKAINAAWGPENIDLGAYGESIFTTSAGNQYGSHSGTSFAAPHVAGAIGLLYAAPCTEIIALAKIDPQAAAILVKQLLLNSVTLNADLENRTLSNGRLNLNSALQQYQEQCASCLAPFALSAEQILPYATRLKWLEPFDNKGVTLRWRKAGATTWTIVENVMDSYLLEGLTPCCGYETAVRSTCEDGEASEWSPTFEFITTGCCETPTFSWVVERQDSAAIISWTILDDFTIYKILLRSVNEVNWHSFIVQDGSVIVPNLTPCTKYEFKIQGWCLDSWLNLVSGVSFETLGCSACLDKKYCVAGAELAQEEWIAAVQLGSWQFQSGSGGGGYQNHSAAQSSNPQIAPQSAINVSLVPGFWGTPYKEYFRIYIDYNLDGDFKDAGELAFDPGYAQEGTVSGTLTSPNFDQTGTTRMRVMMKYIEADQMAPEACGFFSFGQVEDYCVDLVGTATSAKASFDSTAFLKIYPQPATDAVWIDVSNLNASAYNLRVWDITGRKQLEQVMSPLRNKAIFLDTSRWPSGIYFLSTESAGKIYRAKLIKH